MMRLAGKIALVVGAGQSPGEGIGNGRATVLRFAQEGAKILAVDRDLASAEETAALAAKSGGECVAFQADVTHEATLVAAMAAAVERWGRIDILHNNVGVSIAGGDKPLDELTEAAFDSVSAINLRGTIMACKHVLPVMRRQRSGAIINISSVAAYENTYPLVAYKATKAAMIAFTEQLALHNAPYGIRANCILPGLMDTPMAVDTRARASNRSRAEVAAERDARVPLRGKMGTGWDVANAALFLASDEANFITGAPCGSMAARWSRSVEPAQPEEFRWAWRPCFLCQRGDLRSYLPSRPLSAERPLAGGTRRQRCPMRSQRRARCRRRSRLGLLSPWPGKSRAEHKPPGWRTHIGTPISLPCNNDCTWDLCCNGDSERARIAVLAIVSKDAGDRCMTTVAVSTLFTATIV
jgi:NAD(P)-dependent dehydrogenase (short-subunit alcohol dehydrogenase family)